MPKASRTAATIYVGLVRLAPDDDGWQASFEIGRQGNDLVAMSVLLRALAGIDPGGLTAERARALMKPGAAIRTFARAVDERTATAPATDAEIRALRAGKRLWRAEPTAEYLKVAAELRALPSVRGRRRDPRLRRLETARLYVKALGKYQAPLERVAKQQGRTRDKVRDDLHAARAGRPQLLTTSSKGRAGGVLTDYAIRLLRDEQATTASAAGKGKRP